MDVVLRGQVYSIWGERRYEDDDDRLTRTTLIRYPYQVFRGNPRQLHSHLRQADTGGFPHCVANNVKHPLLLLHAPKMILFR